MSEQEVFLGPTQTSMKVLFTQTVSQKVFERAKAAVRRCSSKQVFLKISQISQKNTFVGVSF